MRQEHGVASPGAPRIQFSFDSPESLTTQHCGDMIDLCHTEAGRRHGVSWACLVNFLELREVCDLQHSLGLSWDLLGLVGLWLVLL